MSSRRMFAAGVVIKESTLWISGGLNSSSIRVSSSDLIQIDNITAGPDLPIPIYGHTMVNIR